MGNFEKLIDYLPDILQKAPKELEGKLPFIKKFLQLFEDQFDLLESQVDKIPNLFDPWNTKTEFLPWLASWLDLSLPEKWGDRTKRSLIDNIFSIYRKRGTFKGLDTILKIYLGPAVKEIREDAETPYLFVVTINFPIFEPAELTRRTKAIREVIDKEKPVHTDYEWHVLTPTMQINFHSTIGVDTILGTTKNDDFQKK